MDVDGGNLKRLTDGNYPSWSSTGTHIVFFRFHGGLNPISRMSHIYYNLHYGGELRRNGCQWSECEVLGSGLLSVLGTC